VARIFQNEATGGWQSPLSQGEEKRQRRKVVNNYWGTKTRFSCTRKINARGRNHYGKLRIGQAGEGKKIKKVCPTKKGKWPTGKWGQDAKEWTISPAGAGGEHVNREEQDVTKTADSGRPSSTGYTSTSIT